MLDGKLLLHGGIYSNILVAWSHVTKLLDLMTTRLLDLLLMSCWCSCWCHAAWTRSRRHLVRILPQKGRLYRDGTQDHDIWLLFTINTYLIHLWCPCSFIHNQYIFNPTPLLQICLRTSECPRKGRCSWLMSNESRQMFRSHESRQSGQMFNDSGK